MQDRLHDTVRLVVTLAFICSLMACGSVSLLPGGGAEVLVGEVEHVPCPDFQLTDCTEGFPPTISGLPLGTGAEAYEMLFENCRIEAEAHRAAQRACENFKIK